MKRKRTMPKLKKLKQRTAPSECLYRAAKIERVDRDERAVDIVLATETPVPVYDMDRMEVIDEVIRMDGVELPDQIPLVDSHQKESVRNVLGSIRDLRIDGDRLIGRAYFSSNPEAQKVFGLYADRHLTDFSIGARQLAITYEDEQRVVSRSRPLEGSAVAVGADPNAKAMSVYQRAYFNPRETEKQQMSEFVDSLRDRFDIPTDVANDAVIDWLQRNHKSPESKKSPEKPMPKPLPDAAEIRRQERDRMSAIQSACRKAGLDETMSEQYIAGDFTAEQVAMDIIDRNLFGIPGAQHEPADKPTGGIPIDTTTRISGGAAQLEKFYDAVGDALTQRVLDDAEYNPDRVRRNAVHTGDRPAILRADAIEKRLAKKAPGADDFEFASLTEIARKCLIEHGYRGVERMNRPTIVRQAFAMQPIQRADSAYHSTGSFPQLLMDASNKTLLAGYDEQMVSYTMWVRTAAPAADYKTLNRIKFGEIPNPTQVPENFPYPEAKPTDDRESYSVKKYGSIFTVTLEAIVNDDLDAISRIPAMHGAAHRRKVNKSCYDVLTENNAMRDGIALFHGSSHGANLDATALSVAALNTGYSVMMQQKGLTDDAILNIVPRYLIVPAGLSGTAAQIVDSTANPDNTAGSTEDASRPNFNSGTANIYGPGGMRGLTLVYDAQLDGTSSTGWYLAADPRQVDTVEVTFLRGEETPVVEREEGFDTDVMKFKSRQSFAAAAIDYRGLYQGNS